MPGKLGKRAVRKLKRNRLFVVALLLLLVLVIVALRFAPHNEDAPTLSVPVATDG